MSIRDQLRRRCRQTAAGSVVFLLLVGVATSVLPPVFVVRFVIAVPAAAIVAAAVVSLFQIACPQCRRSLGAFGFWIANGARQHDLVRCPHCGTDFDADAPIKPQNPSTPR